MKEKRPPRDSGLLSHFLDDETLRCFDRRYQEFERLKEQQLAPVPERALNLKRALELFESIPRSEASLELERTMKRLQSEASPNPFDSVRERLDELERLQLSNAKAKAAAAASQAKKRAIIERRAQTLKKKTAEKHRELDELICGCGKRGDDFRQFRKDWQTRFGVSQATLTTRIQALRARQWRL